MKLFIIGNGFDLSHNLETSYENFRQFLSNYLPYEEDYDICLHSNMTDVENACCLFFKLAEEASLNGYEWNNLEKMLGQFDFREYLKEEIDNLASMREYSFPVDMDYEGGSYASRFRKLKEKIIFNFVDEDEDNEDNEGTYLLTREEKETLIDYHKSEHYDKDASISFQNIIVIDDISLHNQSLLISAIEKLKKFLSIIINFFGEWINTIKLSRVQTKDIWKKLINTTCDKFLTCNYTKTLEEIYNVPSINICHIHGQQGEEIIFGHGEIIDYENDCEDDYDYVIDDVLETFRKKTEECLHYHSSFFTSLNEQTIEQIYSFGFSFSEVDLIYIEKICKYIETDNITWYLSTYDKEKNSDRITKIRACGFKGKFETFDTEF